MAKRALVAGINDYSAIGVQSLSYCVNDADSIMELLVTSFGFSASESVKLTNAAATSNAIQSSISSLLAASQPGDVVCFFFSGHGSTQAATSAPDCEIYQQTIIPASGPPITDAMLYQLANALPQSQVNMTVVLDSCHSGGMSTQTDGSILCKSPPLPSSLLGQLTGCLTTLVPFGICLPDVSALNSNVSNVQSGDGLVTMDEDPDKVFTPLAKTTLIAACRFNETADEQAALRHGVLTRAILDVINSDNYQSSYNDLLTDLRSAVTKYSSTQTPQLRGQVGRLSQGFLQEWTDSR